MRPVVRAHPRVPLRLTRTGVGGYVVAGWDLGSGLVGGIAAAGLVAVPDPTTGWAAR
jgi:hypothetical protein